MSGFAPKSMKMRNKKGLALNSAPAPPPASSASDVGLSGLPGGHDQPDTLEIGKEYKLDLNADDLIVLKELGAGNGGSVSKVEHKRTKAVMARKVSVITLGRLHTPAYGFANIDHPRRGQTRNP